MIRYLSVLEKNCGFQDCKEVKAMASHEERIKSLFKTEAVVLKADAVRLKISFI